MRVSIFGMGYVGTVTGACLAQSGHEVVGVDVNPQKVAMVNDGRSPIVEEHIPELIAEAVRTGRLHATADHAAAIAETDLTFISVGTPSLSNGRMSLTALDLVAHEIGDAIRMKPGEHTVIVRSTVLPGTTEARIIPILTKRSGRSIGEGLEAGFHPEFLREGSSVRDFRSPPYTIIGSSRPACRQVLEELYLGINAPVIETSFAIAEAVKCLSNMFHAVKISYANEVGSLLKELGVDSREAMRIFCEDRLLNISEAYLRPGFAFGGSCLPKDLRAFLGLAREHDIDLPLLGSVLSSNQQHVERALGMITAGGRRKVALFGLAFKAGTDDLRESPLVVLAERLIGKGYEIGILDDDVDTSRLVGANEAFIRREVPHLDRVLARSAQDVLRGAEIAVIGHAGRAAIDAILGHPAPLTVIDLQGVGALRDAAHIDYQGICW